MAMMPRRVKHRKSQRRRIKGNATRGNTVVLGDYGLQSTQAGHITAQTIEAGRIAAQQYVRGIGKLYIRIFPHKPISKKPAETRMGKGKGSVDRWVARVAPGRILFEIDGVPDEVAIQALKLGAAKLPIKTKIIKRIEGI